MSLRKSISRIAMKRPNRNYTSKLRAKYISNINNPHKNKQNLNINRSQSESIIQQAKTIPVQQEDIHHNVQFITGSVENSKNYLNLT
jgi:hypothetical protein